MTAAAAAAIAGGPRIRKCSVAAHTSLAGAGKHSRSASPVAASYAALAEGKLKFFPPEGLHLALTLALVVLVFARPRGDKALLRVLRRDEAERREHLRPQCRERG